MNILTPLTATSKKQLTNNNVGCCQLSVVSCQLIATLIFFITLLTPTVVQAEVPEPLSPAVQLTVTRAEEAVAVAQNQVLLELALSFLPQQLLNSLSVVLGSIDTSTSITIQTQNLDQQTACFRYDEWVLQQEADRVREMLDQAIEQRRLIAISGLEEIYEFLIREERELRSGGWNPEVMNAQWHAPLKTELAMNPQLQNQPPAVSDVEPFCYFHSDYLPPATHIRSDQPDRIDGYGCDTAVIDQIIDNLPSDSALAESMQKERDALELAEQEEERQMRIQAGILLLAQNVDSVAGGGNSVTAAIPEREHIGPQSGCVDQLDEGILLRNLRGNFSTEVQDARLLSDFQELRKGEGEQRPPPAGLQSTPENAAARNFFEAENDRRTVNVLREFSIEQALSESMTFAGAGDPSLSGGDAFRQLRTAVAELARLGSTMEGLRGFVRDFAFFLRRSCLTAPCNKRLDVIEKLIFTDACFPYASGDYTQSTCGEPQWKKCVYGALYPDQDIPAEECEEEMDN